MHAVITGKMPVPHATRVPRYHRHRRAIVSHEDDPLVPEHKYWNTCNRLLPESATVTFHVLDAVDRPVSAVADYTEVRRIERVSVTVAADLSPRLLFDPEHNLEERIFKEQFLP